MHEPRGRKKYLVSGHSKRVHVALLRWVAIRAVKPLWVQKFWSQVTSSSRLGGCYAVSLHDTGIGDNPCNPKVSEARVTFLGDQDVPLDRFRIDMRSTLIASISYRSDVTVYDAQ